MALGRFKPSNLTIVGVALLLFAAVLMGYGIHHLVRTGTCSSTGYSGNFGPVPHCPSGTAAWVAFLVGGIFAVLIGAGLSGSGTLIFPGLFCSIGVGALTVAFDATASWGAKTFGIAFGAAFFITGAIPALFIPRRVLRNARTGDPAAALGER